MPTDQLDVDVKNVAHQLQEYLRRLEPVFVNNSFVQLTLRSWERVLSNPRLYVMFAFFVAAFTVISPLGFDDNTSLYGRLTLSLTANGVSWAIGIFLFPPLRILFEKFGMKRVYAVYLSATICAQFVIMYLVWVLKSEFSHVPATERILELSVFMSLLAIVICYGLSKNSVTENTATNDTTENAPEMESPECAGVQEKIPPHKRGTIWAIVAQDHYVEVITDKGSELVLMRLSDAISMCEAENSMRIHRSVWVSIEGIKRITKSGRRMMVEMPNGRKLPVARSAEKKLNSLAKQIMAEEFLPA